MNMDVTDLVIMVVEDEETTLAMIKEILYRNSFKNVLCFSNPIEAFKSFVQCQPHLVLLDIQMPTMDGFQWLDAVNEYKDTLSPPVVVLTAEQSHEAAIQALEKGARDFITKPFHAAVLTNRVTNHLTAHYEHLQLNTRSNELEKQVNQRTQQLKDSRLAIIQSLSRAAEFRDEDTGNHILRMSHTCYLLAKNLGWPEKDCEIMLNASPMHDVGKIGIPDRILLKPGKLDEEEWKIMKTHATIGQKLIVADDGKLLNMARDIAHYHHERWDGTGYPEGLRAHNIPESARIVAVADVFDALTSKRPYKSAWSVQRALNFLKENRGTHFDPAVIDVFFDSLLEVLEIRKRFRDDSDKCI